MEIPLNVDVTCDDGLCGRSTYVVVNPLNRQVTHVVVREAWFPHTEYIVPLAWVTASNADGIRLNCARGDLVTQDPFLDVEYVRGDLPEYDYEDDQVVMWPYALSDEDAPTSFMVQHLPPNALALRRGAHVIAADGQVGRLDEFVIDPESGRISHLVLREGHLWGQRDVTIPVSEIAAVEEQQVRLKLTRKQIEALPFIKLRR